MTKMTVTQALWERKNLKARIERAANEGVFLGVVVGDDKVPVNSVYQNADALAAKIQSSHDTIHGLLERYHKIVAGLLKFNAETKVTIAGMTMTVAQAIERRESFKLELAYLSAVKTSIKAAASEVDTRNRTLQREIENRVSNNKVEGMTADEICYLQQDAETVLSRQRKAAIFDPVGTISKMETQVKNLQEFTDTLEVELNVINATHSIEI